MRKVISILAILLCCGISHAMMLPDVTAPEWRGLPGTTWAEWDFSTNNPTPIADAWENPFGTPELTVYPIHPWNGEIGGRFGVWALSGLVSTRIPNQPIANEYKLLQVQFIWTGEFPSAAAVPTLSVSAVAVDDTPIVQSDIVLLSETDLLLEPTGNSAIGENWHLTTYLYQISPNPKFETIDIAGSILMDKLVIDTWCVPEPTTMILLGLGSLMTLRKCKA